MGTFFAEALLAAPQSPEHREPVKLLVDSGALSVVPSERRRVVTIEGLVAERDAAEVLITLEGRTLHTVCLFGEAGELDVLGAYTLEGFGLGIDPVQRVLIRRSSTARRQRSCPAAPQITPSRRRASNCAAP